MRSAAGAGVLSLGLAGVLLLAAGGAARADGGGPPQRLFRIASAGIDESSGLAASATLSDVLWTVNDSGGTPQVFGLGPDGRTVATVTLRGATNRDWEAVAVGPRAGGGSWLWAGDIGDNQSVWPSIRVYRVAEPTSPGDRTVSWTAYDLVYPDGPRDAEALLVDPSDGRLYVVSKRVQGAAVYRAPAALRTDRVNRLTKVASAPPLVTDGSFAPDGRVALRDYVQAYVSPTVQGGRQTVDLPLLPQGESLTWTRDGSGLVEGSEGAHSQVWLVPVAAPAGASSSPAASETVGGVEQEAEPAQTPAPPDDRTPWLVVAAGLLVGAVLGLLVPAVRRRRSRPPA